jgi:hypothetical protein
MTDVRPDSVVVVLEVSLVVVYTTPCSVTEPLVRVLGGTHAGLKPATEERSGNVSELFFVPPIHAGSTSSSNACEKDRD